MPKSQIVKQSLWTLAYENLREANPKKIQKLNFYLGISNTDADDGESDLSRIEQVTNGALEQIRKAKIAKEKLNKTSAAIRKSFEQIVNIIVASNDFISSAVSANPYAALAWTGVSLLLPVSPSRRLFSIVINKESSYSNQVRKMRQPY